MAGLSEFHILIADDEKLFVDAISDHLPSHFPNAKLRVAYDGLEALRLAEDPPPVHLLVTDLRMPGLDGLGLLKCLQDRGFAAPVAVMTAYGTLEVEQQARALGAGYFLRKPIDLDALVAVVETEVAKFSTNPVALNDLLRSLVIGGQSGDVKVGGEDGIEGHLFFRRGLLVDAAVRDLVGEPAALEVLGWPHPLALGFRPVLPGQPATISRSLNELLADARRRRIAATKSASGPDQASAPTKGGPSNSGSPPQGEPLNLKEPVMANIRESLEEAMRIDGAIAAALVDYNSGMCLGAAGGGPQFNIEVAAAGNTAVVRAKMKVMKDLGLKEGIEDILITLGKQYHLIRPLAKAPNLFMYLATDRERSNLALARHRLSAIEESLQVG